MRVTQCGWNEDQLRVQVTCRSVVIEPAFVEPRGEIEASGVRLHGFASQLCQLTVLWSWLRHLGSASVSSHLK